ncbi:MAG TPA: type II toxin-antitoxin system death-on-curing family toxin [Candidatus Babeliaceae bacterium]|nr:type II toxin-antitoxin system death-on-curing family toxin [Candidatus Babeliaceae bacterium]
MFIIFIGKDEVIQIHEDIIKRYGGREGIHHIGLLESAINHPLMMLQYGNEEDQAIYSLAAAYFFHIIKNHPFIDGNKRTALLTTLNFLDINGFTIDTKYELLYNLAINTAASIISEKDIVSFFKKTIKNIGLN